jgi:aspartyl-tRNA(Asn)/glutamyl-tRNA(Gln) amidotransferase subunit C
MVVDRKTVKKVAGLARLDLTERELVKFSRDLDEVLLAFGALQRIPTGGVRPTFRPLDARNVLRDDRVEPSTPRKRLLRNLKNREDGYIKGPRVV